MFSVGSVDELPPAIRRLDPHRKMAAFDPSSEADDVDFSEMLSTAMNVLLSDSNQEKDTTYFQEARMALTRIEVISNLESRILNLDHE